MRRIRKIASSGGAGAHLRSGLAAYRAGSLEAAIEEFTAALGLDPGLASARYQRGMAYARSGDLAKAIEDFRWVAEQSVELRLVGDAWYNLGLAAERSGDLEAAVDYYERAAKHAPSAERALCNRGAVLCRLERFEEAVRDLSEAIALDPSDALAYWNRALANHALRRPDAVKEDVGHFLRLAPADHPYRARAERLLGTEPRARAATLDRAAAKEAGRLITRIVQLNNEERYEEALALCDRLLELNDSQEIAWDEKAFALIALERWEEAEATCDRGLVAVRDAIRLHHTRGSLLERRGRHREAVAAYRTYVRLAPPEYGAVAAKAQERIRQLEAGLGKGG